MWRLTHTIIRNGIDQLLPDQIELIRPGLSGVRDPAGPPSTEPWRIAARPDVIFAPSAT